MVFGHVNPPLRLHTEKHLLIMASTRSGKGVALIIPHLLRYAGSAFVLDPKGENARATWHQRNQLNGTVHALDPFGIAVPWLHAKGITTKPASCFNPLSRFTPDNMEALSKALAAAMVIAEGRVRDHWIASGQQLLAAFIMWVYASRAIPPADKDLPQVRRLLLREAEIMLDKMAASANLANGLIADLAVSFLATPPDELGSIISTAQRETDILDNPFLVVSLAASGSGDEVNFADWHAGTMTVYLCLAAPKFPAFNRWLRLVLTAALDEMTETLNPPPRLFPVGRTRHARPFAGGGGAAPDPPGAGGEGGLMATTQNKAAAVDPATTDFPQNTVCERCGVAVMIVCRTYGGTPVTLDIRPGLRTFRLAVRRVDGKPTCSAREVGGYPEHSPALCRPEG